MEFREVVDMRRMVRSFSEQPVPEATLREVLERARRAPTAGNTDGWALVVLRGAQQTAVLWDCTTTAQWRRRARRWPGLSKAPVAVVVLTNPTRYIDRYSEPDKAPSGLGHRPTPPAPAPALALALALAPQDSTPALRDSTPVPANGDGGNPWPAWPVPFWFVDAGHVVLSLLLAAVDVGLGACFLGNFRGEPQLLRALQVPDDWRFVGSVLLGTADGPDPRSPSLDRPKRLLDDIVHYGTW